MFHLGWWWNEGPQLWNLKELYVSTTCILMIASQKSKLVLFKKLITFFQYPDKEKQYLWVLPWDGWGGSDWGVFTGLTVWSQITQASACEHSVKKHLRCREGFRGKCDWKLRSLIIFRQNSTWTLASQFIECSSEKKIICLNTGRGALTNWNVPLLFVLKHSRNLWWLMWPCRIFTFYTDSEPTLRLWFHGSENRIISKPNSRLYMA